MEWCGDEVVRKFMKSALSWGACIKSHYQLLCISYPSICIYFKWVHFWTFLIQGMLSCVLWMLLLNCVFSCISSSSSHISFSKMWWKAVKHSVKDSAVWMLLSLYPHTRAVLHAFSSHFSLDSDTCTKSCSYNMYCNCACCTYCHYQTISMRFCRRVYKDSFFIS